MKGGSPLMEQETSLYHLLMEHQIAVFLISAVILVGLVLATIVILGRYVERRTRLKKKSDLK